MNQKKNWRGADKKKREREAEKRGKEGKQRAKLSSKQKESNTCFGGTSITANSSDSEVSDAQCPICGMSYQSDDSKSVWVCCDKCESWLNSKIKMYWIKKSKEATKILLLSEL